MNFIDLKVQYELYRNEIQSEMNKVLESTQFIMGPAVGELEMALSQHSGARSAIACSSGTDALYLSLLALGIRPGDEVVVPDFTFIATAEVVALAGATPVFVDIRNDTFNMDPALVASKVTAKTRGIIPVSLFGQCADLEDICSIAAQRGLWVIEDAAQSYGAVRQVKKSCDLCECAATSFFPAKPLGCYGDGGAVFTQRADLEKKIRILLNHGQTERYCHSVIGMNGRLDTLQAAILKVKLRHFDEELALRQHVASTYTERLQGLVQVPVVQKGNTSVWAEYTIMSPARDAIMNHLKARGIPSAIYYPIPLHRQPAFSARRSSDAEFPVSVKASAEVLSLPMHPFLSNGDVDVVADAVREALE